VGTHIHLPCDGCSTDGQRGGSPCKLWSFNGSMVPSLPARELFPTEGPACGLTCLARKLR